MARPLRIHVEGAAYHVLSRGNGGEHIFAEEGDKRRLIDILATGVERYRINLYAYCIMGNHYHLLLSSPAGKITPFMHYVGSSYGSFQRRCRGRIGHVFAGRFKSICVEKELYLHRLSRYIHLNPFAAGAADEPSGYRWSSCRFYVGRSSPPPWLNREWLLRRYGPSLPLAQRRYAAFLREGMGRPNDYPREEIVGQILLGGREFVARATAGESGCRDFTEVSARRVFEDLFSLDALLRAVCEYYGLRSSAELRSSATGAVRAREMFVWLAKGYTRALNREIAAWTGHRSPSAVAHQVARILLRIKGDGVHAAQWREEAESITSRFKG